MQNIGPTNFSILQKIDDVDGVFTLYTFYMKLNIRSVKFIEECDGGQYN